jgi:hypothetical protein
VVWVDPPDQSKDHIPGRFATLVLHHGISPPMAEMIPAECTRSWLQVRRFEQLDRHTDPHSARDAQHGERARRALGTICYDHIDVLL